MKLEGKIKHGIALAIDHNDYVDCDVVYYGGMTIRLVNASYDDLSIAFGPVGSYVDMSAYYTKEEIDNKGYLTEHQDISGKADKVDTYTKAETNTLLDAKANASTTYTKSEVDTLISNVDIDIDDVPTSGSDHAVSSGGVYDSLENKQSTLVSGTNIKTINNQSLLGSGNISIEGGGSSMSITYNANTQALVIGGGSVNTYTITFNIEYGFAVQINGGEVIIDQSLISVNEGDSVIVHCMTETRPTATMGGESITVYSSGPDDFYFTIESVTGDIVVSV